MPEAGSLDLFGVSAFAKTHGWWVWGVVSLATSGMLFARYAALVGAFQWLFVWGERGARFAERRVYRKPRHRPDQVQRELRYATVTSLIFGVITAGLLVLWQQGWLRIYLDVHAYPLWWLPLSLLTAMLIHETYYYWLHRLMHLPRIYPWLHRGHHDSITTTAWTSFAFDPGEAVLQAAILPAILAVVPMHGAVVVTWLTLMTLSAIVNHLGVELYPRGTYRHWLGKQFIGATHHGLHHTRFTKNYGLYFTFWDRWMGTEAAETGAEFERNTLDRY